MTITLIIPRHAETGTAADLTTETLSWSARREECCYWHAGDRIRRDGRVYTIHTRTWEANGDLTLGVTEART